jgi:hypothetical protein
MLRYELTRDESQLIFRVLEQDERNFPQFNASNGIFIASVSCPAIVGNGIYLRGCQTDEDHLYGRWTASSPPAAEALRIKFIDALNEFQAHRYPGQARQTTPTKPPYFIKAEFHRVGATIHMHVKDQYGGNERPGGKWPTFTATNGMRVISNNNPAINSMDIFVRGRSPTARDQVDAFMGSDAQAQTLMLKMVAAIDEFNAFYGGKKKVWVSDDELEPSTEKPTFDMPKRR